MKFMNLKSDKTRISNSAFLINLELASNIVVVNAVLVAFSLLTIALLRNKLLTLGYL